jgi:tRNA(fMet)-specific endonuclease VapC
MGLILDTSVIIDIERGVSSTIETLFEISKKDPDIPNIGFISYAEYYYGLLDKSIQNKSRYLSKIDDFNCIQASKETAKIIGELKHKYDKKGLLIQVADLIIVAQAKEHNLTLVTKDKIFSQIDEIRSIIIE